MLRTIHRGAVVVSLLLLCLAACTSSSPGDSDDSTGGNAPSAGNAPVAGGTTVGGNASGGAPSSTGGAAPSAGAAGTGACEAPRTVCNGACRNTMTDAANCGGCGKPCATGQACQSGVCGCATGSMSCNGACADIQSDPANCGACGKACTTGQVCSKGACSAGCAAGLTKCGAACVDVTGSQINCGTCGNACPTDQTCWQSACICGTGEGACGANNACIDVQANTTHCGKCGNACAKGATCTAGACTCPGAQIVCNGTCVDAAADKNNCGKCGTVCTGSTSCLSGACLDPSTLSCSGAQTGNSCTKDANVTLGPYWVNNNWWGASGASGQTCIWGNCSTGDLAGWGQSFNWSGGTAGQVKTYASIIYGWQWGWKTGSGGQRLVTTLPLQLNTSKAVNCGWNFAVTQTGTITINVAYDLFVHTVSNAGTNDDPTDEIMIWLYRANGAGPLGTKQGATFDAGGGTFDFYSGDNTRWKVHSYVRQTNATTAVLNMMDFMKDLAKRGLVANTKYLSSVQAGSEIFSGQGQVQTNGFYCRVQ